MVKSWAREMCELLQRKNKMLFNKCSIITSVYFFITQVNTILYVVIENTKQRIATTRGFRQQATKGPI